MEREKLGGGREREERNGKEEMLVRAYEERESAGRGRKEMSEEKGGEGGGKGCSRKR